MLTIKFPKRIKWASEDPLTDFYLKCLLSTKRKRNNKRIMVSAFTVHPNDYEKLEKLIAKNVSKRFPYYDKKTVGHFVQYAMFDIGPCSSPTVQEGTVQIDEKKMFL